MEGEVKNMMDIGTYQDLDSIDSPIVNTGTINRDDMKKHSEKSPGKCASKTRDNFYRPIDN